MSPKLLHCPVAAPAKSPPPPSLPITAKGSRVSAPEKPHVQAVQELWTAAALLNDLTQVDSSALAAGIQAAAVQAPAKQPLADMDAKASTAAPHQIPVHADSTVLPAAEESIDAPLPGAKPSRRQLKEQRRRHKAEQKAAALAAKQAAKAAKATAKVEAKAAKTEAKAAKAAAAQARREARVRKPCWLFKCCCLHNP